MITSIFAVLSASLAVDLVEGTPVHADRTKPHILFVLQDDLGRYNVAFNADRTDKPSADVRAVSPQLTMLAKQGITLDRHYVHWHCSPTRRSLLTGRVPLHHGEELSGIATDDIDLRWTTIGQKLEGVGYKSHWYGKGHTGYMSMNHLPHRIGFSSGHLGFLSGAMSYHGEARWKEELPFHSTEYSTQLYGEAAVSALKAHDPNDPLFMYLPWQAVHEPYTAPPGYNASAQNCDHYSDACVLYGMLHVADGYVGRLASLLHAKGMWETTLLIFSADNGGVTYGVNYPLRGEKHTNWEGGMRVSAFVSGGFVPERLRDTASDLVMHIADWYPTLCKLAGADPTDDPPVPPLPVDPANPNKDIYGHASWPPVDGVDVWPLLAAGSPPEATAAHPNGLWLSREVMLLGPHKIVVAQPDPSTMASKSLHNGWKWPNGTWVDSDDTRFGCNKYKDRTNFRPCVFDVVSDPREESNLASSAPMLLRSMWALLNTTQLSAYHARSPARLLGPCHPECAEKHWRKLGAIEVSAEEIGTAVTGSVGPICDVPGCGRDES